MTAEKLGRVFITGADGFIGSHLTELLVQSDYEVTALCIYNSQGSFGWLEQISHNAPKNLKLILGDVRDAGFLENAIDGHDTVFHLASLIAIPYSYVAPESYFETNLKGALNVAQASLKAKVRRLIHTSTSEVYGSARFVPITESHPLQAQSPYSASKISADMLMESFWRSFDLPVTILRPFNTYGPRQSLRAIIPTVIAQLLANQKTIKLGSLTPTRDFNYVQDTVAAFLALAQAPNEVLGSIYNAGSGREISVGDLVALISRLTERDVDVVCESSRIRPSNSEVERLLCSAEKLSNATCWQPTVSLEDGLIETIKWLRQIELFKRADAYHR